MSEHKVNIGDPAPDFTTVTETGTMVKLADFRGKRVVLYFYPKDDTETSPKSSVSKGCLGYTGRQRAAHSRWRACR